MAKATDLCHAAQRVHPMWSLGHRQHLDYSYVPLLPSLSLQPCLARWPLASTGSPQWSLQRSRCPHLLPYVSKSQGELSLRHHAHHSCWPLLPPCSLGALASASSRAPQLAHPLLPLSLKPPMRGRSSKPLLLPLSRLSGSCGRRSRPQLSDWSALEGPVSSSSAPPPLRSASSKLRSLQGRALFLA